MIDDFIAFLRRRHKQRAEIHDFRAPAYLEPTGMRMFLCESPRFRARRRGWVSCRILWRQPGKQSVSHALRDEQSCHDHPREDIARPVLALVNAGASPAQAPVAQPGFVVAAFRDSLLLAWGGMLINGAKSRVREAKLQDASRAAIACCMIVAAVASLVGAGILLG